MGTARRLYEGDTIDYTPALAVAAGDVVVLGEMVLISDLDIAANKLGALSTKGVYQFPKKAALALAAGKKAYWDAANSEITSDPAGGANKCAGDVVIAALAADTTVKVRLCAGSSGLRIAHGQHTTVDENDTVATGLAKVVAAVAVLDDDPVDGAMHVTAGIGDQAGAPAAGSILIKTWKSTDADASLVAASTFGKKVNWIAVGY